jgi:hypothetical protein
MAEHDGLAELVTRAEIGRRLHMGRGRAASVVDEAGFPAPVGRLGDRVIWRWGDVRAWAEAARGRAGGPSDEAMHLAGVRDRCHAAGYRLKLVGGGGDGAAEAILKPIGSPSAKARAFTGATPLEAADAALAWLQTHR